MVNKTWGSVNQAMEQVQNKLSIDSVSISPTGTNPLSI